MPNPINNNPYDSKLYSVDQEPAQSTPTKNHEVDENWEDDGWDDWGLGEEPGYGDEFVGDEPGAPQDSYTAEGLIDRINALKGREDVDKGLLDDLLQQIKDVKYLSPEKRPEELARIANEISALEAGPVADPFADPEGEGSAGGLIGELEALIERINDDDKIPRSEGRQLERDIKELIEKLEDNDSDVSQENIREEMAKIEERIEEIRNISNGAYNLEDIVQDMNAEEIQKLATEKGIDLNELPNPPTAEVFEFLAELIPGLKTALQEAEDASAKKHKMDEDMVAKATRTSNANAASTTDVDGDRSSFAEFWYLLRAQTHEDEGSNHLRNRMNDLRESLIGGLKLIYPDVEIKSNGSTYDLADKITFDGEKLDIFHNSEGKFISSTSITGEDDFDLPPLVTLQYDWEGDGDYEDVDDGKSLNRLQDAGYPTACYD